MQDNSEKKDTFRGEMLTMIWEGTVEGVNRRGWRKIKMDTWKRKDTSRCKEPGLGQDQT